VLPKCFRLNLKSLLGYFVPQHGDRLHRDTMTLVFKAPFYFFGAATKRCSKPKDEKTSPAKPNEDTPLNTSIF